MAGATRSIVINAPMEKVFAAVTGYEAYPQFLTECKEVRTTNRTGNSVDVHYKVDVVKTIKYSLRMKEEKPNRVTWTFIEGDLMKDNTGSWLLEDAGEGKTKATYSINMVLPMLVPKSVVNTLVDASLPKMLEAFKRRVEGA